MNKYEWIESEKELPSCDGSYEITNNPTLDEDWTQQIPISISWYDGLGFSYGGVYREPKYWRKWEPREKRYGKIKPDPSTCNHYRRGVFDDTDHWTCDNCGAVITKADE